MNIEFVKPRNIKKGDKVAIISTSRGIIGEKFASHEVKLGIKRLEEYGLCPVFMPYSMNGIKYLSEHPEKRAEDFKTAFEDESIKAVLTAASGVDTYKIIPYLMDDKDFISKIRKNAKIFTGYGDATINHFMLFKLGIVSFYGVNLLCDFAEFGDGMFDYTKMYFEKYFECPNDLELIPSKVWYKDRTNFNEDQININRKPFKEEHGYEVLYGNGIVSGILLGGCLEAIYEAYIGKRFEDEKFILDKANILPKREDWDNKILFFDTNEHKSSPEEIEVMLSKLDELGLFTNLNGVLIAKPLDEAYYEEYKKIYTDFFSKINIPTIYNLNFGHSAPRCFIPYGIKCEINLDNKKIKLLENPFI